MSFLAAVKLLCVLVCRVLKRYLPVMVRCNDVNLIGSEMKGEQIRFFRCLISELQFIIWKLYLNYDILQLTTEKIKLYFSFLLNKKNVVKDIPNFMKQNLFLHYILSHCLWILYIVYNNDQQVCISPIPIQVHQKEPTTYLIKILNNLRITRKNATNEIIKRNIFVQYYYLNSLQVIWDKGSMCQFFNVFTENV